MGDERSWRVALVADRYVNPAPGGLDGLAVLAAAGWGVMQLPDDAYPAEVARLLLAEVVPASAGELREFLAAQPDPPALAAAEEPTG